VVKNQEEIIPRPTVAIFAEFGALELYLVERLLSSFCRISVFTKNPKSWQDNLTHLGQTRDIQLLSERQLSRDSAFDYVIGSLLQDASYSKDKIQQIIACAEVGWAKTLLLFPYRLDEEKKQSVNFVLHEIKKFGGSAAVICISETIGPRMTFAEGDEVVVALEDLLRGKEVIRAPASGNFFPVYLPEVAKEITQLLFSFGPPADSVAIIGKSISAQEFVSLIANIAPVKKVTPIAFPEKEPFAVEKIIRTRIPLSEALTATKDWFARNPLLKTAKTTALPKGRKTPLYPPKKTTAKTLSFLALLFILISPFVFLGLSLGSGLIGLRNLKGGKVTAAGTYFAATSFFATASQNELFLFSRPPLLGQLFQSFYRAAGLTRKAAEIGNQAVTIAATTVTLADNVLGDTVYDPKPYAQEISLGLERLYQEIGFFQGELGSLGGLSRTLSQKIASRIDLETAKNFSLFGRDIAQALPEILGRDKPATYLVLLQNNMELRPTGGFIGSFALITFDGGRISDLNVQDVYSADGQLKGHVEPPEPIKNHLGEANWFLRDSNWDPDFPTSASRAEWFLSKEIGQSVDGVIGVDLEVVKSLLTALGPVSLPDYNLEVNATNLYETTQKEVEEGFFPGSYQKTNFLSVLTRQVLEKLMTIGRQEELPLAKLALTNLQERHLQIFLHLQKAQRAIAALGFDGAFNTPACSGNCYSDWLGLVEANLGVNKANYFTERSFDLTLESVDGLLVRNLVIGFKNSANTALGLTGRYKVYLRVVMPPEAEVGNIEVVSGQDVVPVTPDIQIVAGRKEVGLPVEIMPQQTKSVRLVWQTATNLDFNQSGEYRFYWRKQAGTVANDLSVQATFPQGPAFNFTPKFSLTREGRYVYNTHLARDIFSRISW
jgi:hypothetical protein